MNILTKISVCLVFALSNLLFAPIYQITNHDPKQITFYLDKYPATVESGHTKCIDAKKDAGFATGCVKQITIKQDQREKAKQSFTTLKAPLGNCRENKAVVYPAHGGVLATTVKTASCPAQTEWGHSDYASTVHAQKPASSSKPTTPVATPKPTTRPRAGSEEAVFTIAEREELGHGATKEKYLAAQKKAQQK